MPSSPQWVFDRFRQERGNQAYALHLLGEIAARRDPPEVASAEASYQQALATPCHLHP